MVILVVVMALAVIAGSIGVYALMKKFIWREVHNYIPYAAAAVFVVICAVLMTAGFLSLRGRLYDTAYEEAYSAAESKAEREYAERVEEYTKTLLNEYDDVYSKAYGSAFEEFASRIGSVEQSQSRSMPADNGDEIKLIENEDTETDAVSENTDKDVEVKKSDTPQEDDEKIGSGIIVYYTKSGSVLHKDRNCRYLKNADNILSSDIDSAPSRKMCSGCGK